MYLKLCTKCGAEKPHSEFYTNHRTLDGLTHQCKECICKQSCDWAKNNAARKREINKRWRNNHPERAKEYRDAGNAMWKAINEGRLIRGEVCEFCGSGDRIQGAHIDYSKPLEVKWLCIKCHRKWDMAQPKSKNFQKNLRDSLTDATAAEEGATPSVPDLLPAK
jgi:hypothetical protein